MVSGSLASPTPPSGGEPKERGDKTAETQHGATFKAQVALAAVKGDKTLAELAEQFSLHPTPITEWKQQLLARVVPVEDADHVAGERKGGACGAASVQKVSGLCPSVP
jgi:hypothetical protein